MKIYNIETGILNSKGTKGNTMVKMVKFDDMKAMAAEYENLPAVKIGFTKENRFARINAGLLLNIRNKYQLGNIYDEVAKIKEFIKENNGKYCVMDIWKKMPADNVGMQEFATAFKYLLDSDKVCINESKVFLNLGE